MAELTDRIHTILNNSAPIRAAGNLPGGSVAHGDYLKFMSGTNSNVIIQVLSDGQVRFDVYYV